jgi:hypothetical protein
MSISEGLASQQGSEEDNPFVAFNPDSNEFSGDTGKEVTVQHIKYRYFPRDLSLRANTE